jgi:hypothetical protein
MTRALIVSVALVAAFLAGATAYRRARIDARLAELDEDTGFVPMSADWWRGSVTFQPATVGVAYFDTHTNRRN